MPAQDLTLIQQSEVMRQGVVDHQWITRFGFTACAGKAKLLVQPLTCRQSCIIGTQFAIGQATAETCRRRTNGCWRYRLVELKQTANCRTQ